MSLFHCFVLDTAWVFWGYGNTFLIDTSCCPIRQEAGPGERQAVVRQAELLDALQVLLPQLVAVTGHISILLPKHSAFLVTKCVPDTRSLAVCQPATSTQHKWVVSFHKSMWDVDRRKITVMSLWGHGVRLWISLNSFGLLFPAYLHQISFSLHVICLLLQATVC